MAHEAAQVRRLMHDSCPTVAATPASSVAMLGPRLNRDIECVPRTPSPLHSLHFLCKMKNFGALALLFLISATSAADGYRERALKI